MQEDEEQEDPIYKKVITDTSDNRNKKSFNNIHQLDSNFKTQKNK